MTEEKKQKLKQLLKEAIENLHIRYEYGPLSIPIDVYRRYLQECWKFFGVDSLSFNFSTNFTLVIVEKGAELKPFGFINENAKLFHFIKGEFAPFSDDEDFVSIGGYIVERGFTNGRLFCPGFRVSQPHGILEHLLKIAIVRGIEEAVSAPYPH